MSWITREERRLEREMRQPEYEARYAVCGICGRMEEIDPRTKTFVRECEGDKK